MTDTDTQIQRLSMEISQTCAGAPLHVSVGAATLFLVCQIDLPPDNQAFAKLTAQKLRMVADIIDPETKD
jgi:hypothetical protein